MEKATLQKELDFFKKNQKKLVEEYKNKFIVIKDEKIEGAYDSEIEAYTEAQKKLALGTFLIQHCVSGEDSYTQTFHSRIISICQ